MLAYSTCAVGINTTFLSIPDVLTATYCLVSAEKSVSDLPPVSI